MYGIRFKTETGSVYLLNYDAGTWERVGLPRNMRSNSGKLYFSVVHMGIPALLHVEAAENTPEGAIRVITTSHVTEIEEFS